MPFIMRLHSRTLLSTLGIVPFLLGLAGSLVAREVKLDPHLPHYEPQPFTIPKDAGYLRLDGSIFIVGAEEMVTGLANLNELFIKSHPGTKFTTLQPGSSVGTPAILFNVAAFAVIDREVLPEEIVPFEYLYKRKPLGIRVGRGSFSKRGYTPPMGIFVHKTNPLERLTTEQVARIYTVGGGTGDITTWGQVGLKGEWERRAIRVLGVGQRTGEGVYMRTERFGDYPYTANYEGMKSPELGAHLAQDTSSIVLMDLSYECPPEGKLVALAEPGSSYYSAATYEDVLEGKYPYTRYTYFYINPDPTKPLDPFVKEYLRMVLSAEGQAALTNEENGFLPLSAQDVAEQLAKLK